ncbi:hypothetical protein BH10ACT7_BH10ACT7_06560 [soil metagenome]
MRIRAARTATILSSALALTALSIAVLLGATPATAAINPGWGLFGINSLLTTAQTVSIDPSNATTTSVGAPLGGLVNSRIYDAASNPIDGTSFAVLDQNNVRQLLSVDVTTGALSIVGQFELTAAPGTFPEIRTIAFAPDGTLYGVDATTGLGYVVDPVTAGLTAVGTFGTFRSFAIDPTTGDLWGIDQNGQLLRADAATPTVFAPYSSLDFSAHGPTSTYGLQIDEDGLFWLSTYDSFNGKLRTFTPTVAPIVPTLVGVFSPPHYSVLAILIVDLTPPGPPVTPAGPQLANGGADFTVASVVAISAGILTLLGVTLVVARRRDVAR